MNQYGEIAIASVNFLLDKNNKNHDPREAWEKSSIKYLKEGSPSQKKGCPRNAFLGLCEVGLIRDVEVGDYTESVKNKKYAEEAAKILKRDPQIPKKELWKAVLNSFSEDLNKTHNGQMDVVLALRQAGLLVD